MMLSEGFTNQLRAKEQFNQAMLSDRDTSQNAVNPISPADAPRISRNMAAALEQLPGSPPGTTLRKLANKVDRFVFKTPSGDRTSGTPGPGSFRCQ